MIIIKRLSKDTRTEQHFYRVKLVAIRNITNFLPRITDNMKKLNFFAIPFSKYNITVYTQLFIVSYLYYKKPTAAFLHRSVFSALIFSYETAFSSDISARR